MIDIMHDIRDVARAMKEIEAARVDLRVQWIPDMEERAEAVRRLERAAAVRALFPARQSETDNLQRAFAKAVAAGVPLR